MDADTHRFTFHVALSDHEHGVHFHLLGVCNLGFDVVAAAVELGGNLMGTQVVEFTITQPEYGKNGRNLRYFIIV